MAPANKVNLVVTPNKTTLKENTTYDVAKVQIKAVSEYQNILTYYDEPVTLKAEGPIEIIGPKLLSLRGGQTATYVKTIGKTGAAKLIVESERSPAITINFKVS